METKVAVIGLIISNTAIVPELNEILSSYDQYIIGRMGLPYEKRNMRVISVIMDAPSDIIGCFTGKISRLSGVAANTVYA
ncbi:MAG: TM1266 family iron-only hydrogenase system putative regulator [Clostridia bacterium]